jgi:dihydrofolate reductase
MTVILVASVAANGVIGRGGDLAWRNSEDLRRLKTMTMGHTLVMGRRNYESIGRPLPGRRTVVLTRQPDWSADGVTVVHDAGPGLDAALDAITADTGDDTVFVFGGAEIYAALLGRVDVLELTEIDGELDGDVFFSAPDPDEWREESRERRDGFAWVRYVRAS